MVCVCVCVVWYYRERVLLTNHDSAVPGVQFRLSSRDLIPHEAPRYFLVTGVVRIEA